MIKLNQDSKGKRFKLVRPLVTHNNLFAQNAHVHVYLLYRGYLLVLVGYRFLAHE